MDFYEFERFANLNLSGNEFKVYRNLLGHRNVKENIAFPSQDLISKEVNLSVSTVKRAVAGLVAKKFIITHRTKCANGIYNRYELKYIPSFHQVKKDEKASESAQESDETYIDDNKKNSMMIEGKTGLTLTRWQKFIATKMDKSYLIRAIALWNKKSGKKFAFLITLYTGLLIKDNVFTNELAKLFKVEFDEESHKAFISRTQELPNDTIVEANDTVVIEEPVIDVKSMSWEEYEAFQMGY